MSAVSGDPGVIAVRRFAEAISHGDVDAAVEVCHPEIEFSSMLTQLEGSTYRGHAGVRRYFADVAAAWDEWRVEVEDVLPASDGRVVIILRMHVRGRGGVALEEEMAHVWELAEGRLRRSRVYRDPKEALRHAGFSAD